MQSAEIADARNLPKKFLDSISLGVVIRTLDGPFAPVPCVSRTAYSRCDDCPDEQGCIIRPVMQEVRDAISQVLDNKTLADMLDMRNSKEFLLNYEI